LLKDILESEVDEKYFLSEKLINGFLEHNKRHIEEKNQTGFNWKPTDGNKKANTLRANAALCPTDNSVIVHNLMPRSSTTGKGGTGHLSRNDGKTYCLDTGNTNAVELREVRQLNRGIIQHIIPEIVSVRKYEVDVLGLQKILKEHKNLNNQQIANYLNVPKTMVEHWFRSDTSFSIPSKDIWMKLKELLEIKTNEFDDSIMTFEDKESVFEKTNRVYDEDGIAPTLTSTSADERILVRDVRQLNKNNQSNNNTQPYQQNRVYDINGISPALQAQLTTGSTMINTPRIRRLTPTECERLQTVKDSYTEGVSDTQRYRMLGNGWTVEVVKHIFSYLNNN
jgi:hypothetical protein